MAERLESGSARGQAWKRFYGTSELLMFMAVFTVFMGILMIAGAGSGFLEKAAWTDPCDVLGLCIGCFHAGMGIWGISFSRQKKGKFPKHAVVVYEEGFGTAGLLGAAAQAVSFGAVFAYIENVPAFRPCLGWGMLAFLACFVEFLCFYSFRQKKIVLLESWVQYVDGFGRTQRWNNGEIGQIVHCPRTERYTVFDKEGKKLFAFTQSMVHVDALLKRFPDCIC